MSHVRAKKHLWQNFLKNPKILDMIVWEKSLSDTHVIEVWPGPGDLTAHILRKSPASLTLIELDGDMIPLLEKRFSHESLQIYLRDVLTINITHKNNSKKEKHGGIEVLQNVFEISMQPYYVYGNIPYYITSPIIHHFLYDVELEPTVAVFTMQKEVAERILARDGCHSVLSLSCQLVSDIEKVCDISPNNFTPVPKVWSTCLKFILKKHDKGTAKKIIWFIKKWFSQKRKKLISNLVQGGYNKNDILSTFVKMNLSENIRAEELSLEQWKILFWEL